MSYEALPNGELAAVVTYLEMHDRPSGEAPRGTLQLRRVARPTPEQ